VQLRASAGMSLYSLSLKAIEQRVSCVHFNLIVHTHHTPGALAKARSGVWGGVQRTRWNRPTRLHNACTPTSCVQVTSLKWITRLHNACTPTSCVQVTSLKWITRLHNACTSTSCVQVTSLWIWWQARVMGSYLPTTSASTLKP